MRLHKYTENQLRDAVASSSSVRQTLKKLGVAPYGGNYDVFWKAAEHFNLDTSHFLGQGWNLGKTHPPKRELRSYLNNEYSIGSHKLRLRLLREKVLPHRCVRCQLTEWLGGPIPLELDHVDGNRQNNHLDNLRLLCPNCHTLTPTYRRSKPSLVPGAGLEPAIPRAQRFKL